MNMRMSIYRAIEQMTGIKQISDKSNLKDDLKLDSLDQVELIMNIEKEYKLPEIDLRHVPNFTTVGELVNFFTPTNLRKIYDASIKKSVYKEIELMTGAKRVSDELKLQQDLRMDSLVQDQIIMNIEKKHKLPAIDFRKIPNFTTVGELVNFCVAAQYKNTNNIGVFYYV